MNAIPVINPATVSDVFHVVGTEFLSIKKNAVAANIPIEIIQNVIPTKSSEANKTVSAFATLEKLNRDIKIKTNNFSLFIVISPSNYFLL